MPSLHLESQPFQDNTDSSRVYKQRLTATLITGSTLFAGTMVGLYHLWYKDYPQSSFHFINDNNEWMQMDKLGHMMTSYYIGTLGYQTMRWCGLKGKKAIWYGGTMGFVYLLTIEILDGFSSEWGASYGDLVFNTLGSSLFVAQQLAWKKQKIVMKFAYHPTDYPQYNPGLLGSNFIQHLLKDYNGQTYWLSANIHSFLRKPHKFPRWLNVAMGYGAEGMTGATNNRSGPGTPDFIRSRHFYLSLDADLTKIKTNSGFLKMLFQIANFVKIPFPTLEYSDAGKFKFHYLYF